MTCHPPDHAIEGNHKKACTFQHTPYVLDCSCIKETFAQTTFAVVSYAVSGLSETGNPGCVTFKATHLQGSKTRNKRRHSRRAAACFCQGANLPLKPTEVTLFTMILYNSENKIRD